MSATPIPDCAKKGSWPGRLWSLAVMMRVFAQHYIEIGQKITDASMLLHVVETARKESASSDQAKMSLSEKMQLHNILQDLSNLCSEIGLTVAGDLINTSMSNPPRTARELDLLAEAVTAELKSKLFLHVPSDRANVLLRSGLELVAIADKFPRATSEIMLARQCYAYGLGTAGVFHAMRAVEIGVQIMASALGVTFDYPIELAEWGKIVGQIEPKINSFKEGARSTEKDANLKFYSEAASQFRHFNNGWRIRVAHARESYSDEQAREVIEHVRSFFETLAERLSEIPV